MLRIILAQGENKLTKLFTFMTKLKVVNKQQEKQQNKNIIFSAQKNEWCSQKRETVTPSLIGLRKHPHSLSHSLTLLSLITML